MSMYAMQLTYMNPMLVKYNGLTIILLLLFIYLFILILLFYYLQKFWCDFVVSSYQQIPEIYWYIRYDAKAQSAYQLCP